MKIYNYSHKVTLISVRSHQCLQCINLWAISCCGIFNWQDFLADLATKTIQINRILFGGNKRIKFLIYSDWIHNPIEFLSLLVPFITCSNSLIKLSKIVIG